MIRIITITDPAISGTEESTLDETEKLMNSCRLCLCQNNDVPIFDVSHGSIKYSEIAMVLANITIDANDNLPKNICYECSSKLVLFYKFKQKCELSHCTLTALIGSSSEAFELEAHLEPASDTTCVIPEEECKSLKDAVTCDEEHFEDIQIAVETIEMKNENVDSAKENNQPRESKEISEKSHACHYCGRIFLRKSTLEQHYTTHTKEKKFSCSLCNKKFTRKNHVDIHMRSHNNIKPYVCAVCGRGFTKSGDLARHKRVHSNRKDYICEVCGKAFKRSTDVTSHMNSHTGRKPYKCKVCDKAYTSHSSMMKHCKAHGHLEMKT